MDLIVKSPQLAEWNGEAFRCAVGKNGFIAAALKREGDGKTPTGRWTMREVFYRPDRLEKPATSLPVSALRPEDGWCEMPEDPNYNRLVGHPYPLPVDRLWRDDGLYDVIVVLGYNDDPVVAGRGSAIFLHCIRPDFGPTAGCVALQPENLLRLLRAAGRDSAVLVSPA